MGYTYVATDLHGCLEAYKKLLEDIDLKKEDRLILLGDVLDRGPHPISIIKDIMSRKDKNIELIMGNHELFALKVLLDDGVESPIDEISESFYSEAAKKHYYTWFFNGGDTTFEEFYPLPNAERKAILDFLQELPSYMEIELKGNKYFLVHAGIDNYTNDEELGYATVENFVWNSPSSFSVPFFVEDPNRYLVFGHTPTFRLPDPEAEAGKIFMKNNYIALDCGCVFGKYHNGRLGCLRLDDMKEFYV